MAESRVKLRWTVSDAEAPSTARFGPRLDDFLARRVPLVSRMHLRSSVCAGAVLVDGRREPPGFRLHAGAQVEARLDPDAPSSMTPETIPLEAVWEDQHLAVVVKPAGMLVHPTRAVKSGTLANALAGRWNAGAEGPIRPILVHRLDKQTSGLMAVAKTRQAAATLCRAFAQGTVSKHYLAWIDGVLAKDRRMIDVPIARVSEDKPQWRAEPTGKPARTQLTVLRRATHRALVRLTPLTGRTNQLRIHCAFIGHPIAGDVLYGGAPAERLFLHAIELEFRHPVTGRELRFSSPVREECWQIPLSM